MLLSKEEKKAKKVELKIELLKAEKEARKQAKKDELIREIAAHSVSRKELDKKWLEAMVRIKEPVFRKNTEVMRHTFDRTLDKKDHLIDLIAQLKHVADDQYQRTVCNFCDIIDIMINNFLADVEAMSKQNDIKSANLFKKSEDEMDCLSKDSKNAENHLKLLMYNAHEAADSLAWTMRGENVVKEDEDTNKYFYVREDLRSFLENSYNAMWDQYKATLKAYIVRSSENQKHVRKLRRKQNMMGDIIDAQAKKIISTESVIKRLRAELALYETGTKQTSFRARRTKHRNACNRLKTSLYNGIDTDVKQLARLVMASDDSVDWLDAAKKKSEKILRVAALCRKFETHHEKILPYGFTMPHTSIHAKTSVRQKNSDNSMVVTAILATSALTRLWQRISKAELSKQALYREKMVLEYENADIMRKLEERDVNKDAIDAFQCPCVQKSSKKSLLDQPHAVDGSLEAKKVISWY